MIWYVTRDRKLWRECSSRREARYWVKILRGQFPGSAWGIAQD